MTSYTDKGRRLVYKRLVALASFGLRETLGRLATGRDTQDSARGAEALVHRPMCDSQCPADLLGAFPDVPKAKHLPLCLR
jgi:hypothetical protein